MKILTINPGSTSTKAAVYEDDRELFQVNVSHDAEELSRFETISDQLPYRKRTIETELQKKGADLQSFDAVVGRGGGLLPLLGGTYEINDILLDHARRGANGVQHPAQLGPQLAKVFAEQCGARAFVVNPPDVDELQDKARITGIRGIYRNVHLHALNLKETAIRHASLLGRRYEDCRLIVCHIGGGISVSAHLNGRMIDGFDIVGGEGPMTPTRCGSVSVSGVLEAIDRLGRKEAGTLSTKSGGFVSHFGTSDTLEVLRRKDAGDAYAALVWDSMLYQIGKCIGSMAVVLEGRVDGILLGGGMVYSRELVVSIEKSCSWIAPVTAYPGEFEMEAMAAGALRVLKGMEPPMTYTGVPVWQGFSFVRDEGMSRSA